MNAQKKHRVKHLQVTEGLSVAIMPDKAHQYIMTTAEVAHGYDCDTSTIRQTLSRNPDEFVEGKHYLKAVANCNDLLDNNVTNCNETIDNNVTNCNEIIGANPVGRPTTYWTKRGIVRLGFFLKCGNAKLFRDWAEDIIISSTAGIHAMAKLMDHEKPLYDILTKYLVRGDITSVAKELGTRRSYVSRIRTAKKRSEPVMKALLERAHQNKERGLTDGYKPELVQYALNLFNPETE